MQEHQSILTDAAVSKDSEMMYYNGGRHMRKFFFTNFKCFNELRK